MVDPSGFTTEGFRFNKAYKIRFLVAAPSDWVTVISELSLCFVFLHVELVQVQERKVRWQNMEFSEVNQKGFGGFEAQAWHFSDLSEIVDLWVREFPWDKNI